MPGGSCGKAACPLRAEPFAPEELTRDAFLDGRLQLWQPRDGYRAGLDPVLLAASIPARPGDAVLELGCGGGTGLACLGRRVPGLGLTGVELQPAYAALARQNLAENALPAEIHCADITDLPPDLRQRSFDHVFANPPFFDPKSSMRADDAGRGLARAGPTPLHAWVQAAARRTKPGGCVTLIQRIERLPELLGAMDDSLGSLQLLPLAPRRDAAPRLMLVRGRKNGRAAFRFHAPVTLHCDEQAQINGKNYTPQITAVVRDAAALSFPA